MHFFFEKTFERSSGEPRLHYNGHGTLEKSEKHIKIYSVAPSRKRPKRIDFGFYNPKTKRKVRIKTGGTDLKSERNTIADREAHSSWKAMQSSNRFVAKVRMGEEDSDKSIEQLKAHSPSSALTVRQTMSVRRATQRVGESDNVAPATGDLCDCCKTAERHVSDSAEHERSLQRSYDVLSIKSVVDSEADGIIAGASTPAQTACHGCLPVRATASSLASNRDSELPSGLYKNNDKPTIDRNFFKSMARTIKANRAPIADAEVVDEEACTHYTGNYTSGSCGEETRYVNWIEGDALRMRIELKFRLIHERMLAEPEASNNRRRLWR
jgi:hypothetical protein